MHKSAINDVTGESLKKSHLLESSSDILNMEEGSSIIGRGNSLDYSKVGLNHSKLHFHFLAKIYLSAKCFFFSQETELYQIYVPILSDIGQEDCPPEICAENPYLCVKRVFTAQQTVLYLHSSTKCTFSQLSLHKQISKRCEQTMCT